VQARFLFHIQNAEFHNTLIKSQNYKFLSPKLMLFYPSKLDNISYLSNKILRYNKYTQKLNLTVMIKLTTQLTIYKLIRGGIKWEQIRKTTFSLANFLKKIK
jgi:hypothetical protein